MSEEQTANSASTKLLSDTDLRALFESNQYDQIDFGCSNGGSLAYGQKDLGGSSGIGLDISCSKVEQTRNAGYDAALADVTQLKAQPNSARFVTMMDFLEHLPSVDLAGSCIEAACEAATDFVFIRQPWFDSDGYLFENGLKLYWSDWAGHPNAMTSLELYRMISRVNSARRWRIYSRTPVTDSSDTCVHPYDAPPNQHDYDADLHGPKPTIEFSQPVYRQIGAIILMKDDPELLSDLEAKTKWTDLIYDSSGDMRFNEKAVEQPAKKKRKLTSLFGG
ncbi:class I SAM-dependent methyltransferase [Ruegeria arenilitoris]|uniref:class I SAM-dependent methyltransferase n=1 Tax=Ruegeria arenilitoris TaxID=1173585 RepID=UPI00147B0306|nr:class I SAM-dependent methyltransferase [Ruegeria arenilitoris]